MISKVFDCEPPCIWNGHNKVLFKTLLRRAGEAGRVPGRRESGADRRHQSRAQLWLHSEVKLISFSECGDDQEVMLVMPAYSWVRGAGHILSGADGDRSRGRRGSCCRRLIER